MAAALLSIILLSICACFCTFVNCEDTLFIAHSPSYVEFQRDAGPIDVTEVPDVLSLALGLSSSKAVKWAGLAVGDLFRRPKANILITIETEDNSFSLESGSSTRLQYPVRGSGAVDLRTIVDTITSMYGDRPLLLELTPDIKGFHVSAEYQSVFKTLPDTLNEVLPLLKGDGSIVADSRLGSLNLTNPADVALLSELQFLREVTGRLREDPTVVTDNIPDLFTFTLAGLSVIQSKYGADSTQAQDAARMVSSFISKFSSEMASLYDGDLLIEVMTPHQEPFVSRQSRSLLAVATSPPPSETIGNKATPYDETYPVIFNIVLWMGILLALAIYAVSYALWYLDPGDTIIYRMTSQRMKID
ncbi:renin receptor-like [Acanthaster planci]|uniref:Renin receptor-like n=1 Tax=Acanthaster planci TaxID=133434 RepID=A0A8B7YMG7_ACAPL|nr:renin receptor-like [Acanthaster planci]